MINKIKKTINIISGIFIFTAIPIILFLLISSRSSILFGMRSFTVLTGSMVPEIPIKSLVIVKPASLYKVGEVITFNRGSITVTHRIVAIKNNEFTTKGDANKVVDPEIVRKSSIIGVDFLIIPYVGDFSQFLKTLPGFLIFIALPILLFTGFELWNIKKEIERTTEERVRKQIEIQYKTQYEPTTV